MNTEEVIEQRRLARIGKHQSDDRLVSLHRKAVEALLNQQDGEHVRKLALERVEKWDNEQLCNPRYVKAWRNILNMPVASMCESILTDEPDGVSLRQNSPFGFLLHESAR
ncbi:hypothetical protein MTYP_02985 [Methylophilaceae bacterium]|nr:hypothetical protein MTYP_02985 [Methylophilaceae bacterium]